MLRSQDGVEEVESPYENLRMGMIKIKTRKDKSIDLRRLVQLLQEEVGFEPITEVKLELRGSLVRRQGQLIFEVRETGQTFSVEKVEAEGDAPPEDELLVVVATLAVPQLPERIVVRHWTMAREQKPHP